MPKLLKFSPARSFSEPFYPKNSENAKKNSKKLCLKGGMVHL